jgi:cytochrome d ubiquinol oxidase subunit II
MEPHAVLTVLFAFIIAFAVLAYVVMDGFDLGLAILFPLFPDRRDRDVMMNSVAPVWDGNETWLVLGGGALFAAFPLGYAILLPALYTPLIVMLLGLVFRGVAFEFRWRIDSDENIWDLAFFGGSLLAALAQGIALGAILQGVKVVGRAYAGGWWDWLTPFSLLTGLATVTAYCLLGAAWLVMKTRGTLQERAFELTRVALFATLAFIVAISCATPFLEGHYWQRWFTFPSIILTAPVPIAVALFAGGLYVSLERRHDVFPFVLSLCLFAVTFGGLGLSIWPYVVPQTVTIWQAASPEKSQNFMLVGVGILIPVILAYTGYAYWVFRGKVDPDAGYHS